MYRLARAVYAEMVLSGITAVGEFHYLHHGPGGQPYDDANLMGEALRAAASDAGLRLTLLDTCYLTGGIDQPLQGTQLRFGDGSAGAWAARIADLRGDAMTRVGAAVHSVRAVPASDLETVAAALPDAPLHVHLSEQPAENEQCLEAYGCTPTRLLHEHGVLSARTTAVHATHLTDDDIALLGGSRTASCFCPTTERDLADGIGPARRLADAGSPLCLGSDQHAVIDAVRGGPRPGGARAAEQPAARPLHPRRAASAALTWQGHAAIGWPEAGRIAVGAPPTSWRWPRTPSAPPEVAPSRSSSAPPRPTSPTWSSPVTPWCGTGSTSRWGRSGRCWPRSIDALWTEVGGVTATLITGVAELVTNAPALGDGSPLGLVHDAALVVEGGVVAWVGPRGWRPGCRRPRGRRQGGRSSRGSSTATRTWCSPASAAPSSRRG